jgi:hypothetical protein
LLVGLIHKDFIGHASPPITVVNSSPVSGSVVVLMLPAKYEERQILSGRPVVGSNLSSDGLPKNIAIATKNIIQIT